MWEPADFKLSDMLGIAGATIGIIIAGGILLQGYCARYIAVFDRFRTLTGEYRANNFSDARRSSLQNQIANYSRQILFLNSAALGVSLALLLFLVTVGVASLSVIYPKAMVLRLVGSFTLFGGLLLIGFGIFLGVLEMFFERHAVAKEKGDFHDIPSASEAYAK